MAHYDEVYFNWQKEIGLLSSKANLFLYRDYIKETDKVLDFGCGGGYLLASLKCFEKLGIEINSEARENAMRLGIRTVECAASINDEWADIIISCHALEHTFHPLEELKLLFSKVKKGGKIIFVVPYDRNNPYHPNDINQELYTWSEMNLGNLFAIAGFKVCEVKQIYHRFPPNFRMLYKIFGGQIFHLFCRIYGNLNRKLTQIRIVAER